MAAKVIQYTIAQLLAKAGLTVKPMARKVLRVKKFFQRSIPLSAAGITPRTILGVLPVDFTSPTMGAVKPPNVLFATFVVLRSLGVVGEDTKKLRARKRRRQTCVWKSVEMTTPSNT